MKLISGDIDLSISQGNDLIYYCASGDQYIAEAAISINSIRTVGLFKGRIILFTSKSQVVPSLPCEVIRIDCDDWLKIRFAVSFDFSKFNRVMYLDTDIVCIKPIHLLLDRHTSGLVSIVTEHYKMKTWLGILSSYFTVDEMRYIEKDNMINAGTFICDGCKCKDLFYTWLLTYHQSQTPNDQAALDRMFYNNKSYFNILPRGIVSMPKQESEQEHSVLVHFCGIRKNRLNLMKTIR